jgi:hypothetical protein
MLVSCGHNDLRPDATMHVCSSGSIGSVRVQLEMAREVFHHLEISQDHWSLASHEDELRRSMKLKLGALFVVTNYSQVGVTYSLA